MVESRSKRRQRGRKEDEESVVKKIFFAAKPSCDSSLPLGQLFQFLKKIKRKKKTKISYDADAFEKVEAGVVKLLLLKEPQLLVEPPPGSSLSPPGSSV